MCLNSSLKEGRASWEEGPVAGQLGKGQVRAQDQLLRCPPPRAPRVLQALRDGGGLASSAPAETPPGPSPALRVHRWLTLSAVPSALTPVSTAHSRVSSLAGRVGALPGSPFHGLFPAQPAAHFASFSQIFSFPRSGKKKVHFLYCLQVVLEGKK